MPGHQRQSAPSTSTQPSPQPATQPAAPQGWMSWAGEKLWNAGSSVASGVGGYASSLWANGESSPEGGETEFGSDPTWEGGLGDQEEDPSWMERGIESVAPSLGLKAESETAKFGSKDFGALYEKDEAEARFGMGGVSAKKAKEVAGLHAKGESDRHFATTRVGDLYGQTEGEFKGLSAGYEAQAQIGKTGASAKASAGVYAAQAEAKGQAGWRIPGTNIALNVTGGLSGAYGVGGEVSGQAGWGEDGFKLGGKASGALGLGGGLSFGFGVGKFDKNAGWFGGSTSPAAGGTGPATTGPSPTTP